MSTQLAAKLQPILSYLVIGNAILLALALLVGGFLILRRFLGRDPAKSYSLDNEQIALEITQEIQRLSDLRRKVYPQFSSPSHGEPEISSHAPSHSAVHAAASSGVDASLLEQLKQESEALRKAHAEEQKNLHSKIAELEVQLVAAKAASPSADPSSQTASVIKEVDPALVAAEVEKEVEKAKAIIEKEKADLSGKVSHLEKVLSEYRIFEEDFALVKKYKSENEQLKKQLQAGGQAAASAAPTAASQEAGGQISQDDITRLFDSVGTSQPETTKIEADNFFSAEMFSVSGTGAPSAEVAPKVAASTAEAPKAEAAPVAAAPTMPTATGGQSISQAEIDALLGGGSIENKEDLEALAESSVNDDKLMAEFEKILGEKETT